MNAADFLKKHHIEIASLIVALSAMFIAVYQAALTRDHNRRSVVPLLVFEIRDLFAHGKYEFVVTNDGPGPAILTGYDSKLPKDFLSYREQIDWSEIKSLLKGNYGINLDATRMLLKGIVGKVVIKPGDTLTLFALAVDKPAPDDVEVFDRISSFLKPGICYRSIYGDRFLVRAYESDPPDKSCNNEGTFKIFNKRVRIHAPWNRPLTQKDVYGN